MSSDEKGQRWPWSKPTPPPPDPPGLLPGNDGQSLGKSMPPWPISEVPPFRREGEQVPREDKGTPLRKEGGEA